VLRERGADHAWITTGDSASASGAIRPRPQRLADRVETREGDLRVVGSSRVELTRPNGVECELGREGRRGSSGRLLVGL